jgi:predicted dehydrogenase
VDFLTYIVGDNPVEVQAKGLDDNGKYHQDNVVIHLTYPDGSLGMITYVANGDRAVSKEYVEVYCGGRLGILDDFRTLELAHHGKIKRITNRLRQDKGHMAIWKAFLNVLQTGGEPPIPYNQLLVTTQVSFAAVESLKSGKPQSITIA